MWLLSMRLGLGGMRRFRGEERVVGRQGLLNGLVRLLFGRTRVRVIISFFYKGLINVYTYFHLRVNFIRHDNLLQSRHRVAL